MKIKTKQVTEKEVDVEFPIYREYGNSIIKLLSEKDYVAVKCETAITVYEIVLMKDYPATVALIYQDGKEIPSSQFEDALHTALFEINAAAKGLPQPMTFGKSVFDVPGNIRVNDALKYVVE